MKLRKWICLVIVLGVFVTVKATQFKIEDATSNIVAWFNNTGSLNITEDLICPACINPEDVNDIDDEDIETDLNTYVDIAGDTMNGNLTMNENAIKIGNWCILNSTSTNLIITNSC